MNFSSPKVFPGFMSFFHDIYSIFQNSMTFPGFPGVPSFFPGSPGRVGTLHLASMIYFEHRCQHLPHI